MMTQGSHGTGRERGEMNRGALLKVIFVFAVVAVTGFGLFCVFHPAVAGFHLKVCDLSASNGKDEAREARGMPDRPEAAGTDGKPVLASLRTADAKRNGDQRVPSGAGTGPSGFSIPMLVWIGFVMLAGGFAHGMMGFGFPLIATPLLTLALPMKQTILVSVVPTLAMNVLNAFRGGRLRESIGRHWYLPLPLMVGAYAGTRLLMIAPNEPFVLVLAVVLFIYLNMERFGKTDIRIVREHPRASGIVFGLVAGVFESTANVSGPALLVYFLLLGLSPRPLVQVLNFAFIAGKLSQTLTWTVSGGISLAVWAQTLPWVLLAAVTLVFGRRIHDRISTHTYMRWLRGFLWAMVVLLVVQFVRLMTARIL